MSNIIKILHFSFIFCKFMSCTLLNDTSVVNKSEVQGRIIGGFPCSTEEFSFMVLICEKDNIGRYKKICGGSIIGPFWVLTAAHCLDKQTSYLILAGLNDPRGYRYIVQSDKYFIHPNFELMRLKNDIGLIKLKKRIPDTSVSYIKIPSKKIETSELPATCEKALIMGWGLTNLENRISPDLSHLQCTFLPVISHEECKQRYAYYGINIIESEICTLSSLGKDACQGDSGGPLICGSVQTGIISWGIKCGVPTNPGVYARVDAHLDFIHTIINASKKQFHVSFIYLVMIIMCGQLMFSFNI